MTNPTNYVDAGDEAFALELLYEAGDRFVCALRGDTGDDDVGAVLAEASCLAFQAKIEALCAVGSPVLEDSAIAEFAHRCEQFVDATINGAHDDY
ncbi:MAG: hypothetical protein ABEN55_00455 [Bradymonadaceae bacterium]